MWGRGITAGRREADAGEGEEEEEDTDRRWGTWLHHFLFNP